MEVQKRDTLASDVIMTSEKDTTNEYTHKTNPHPIRQNVV